MGPDFDSSARGRDDVLLWFLSLLTIGLQFTERKLKFRSPLFLGSLSKYSLHICHVLAPENSKGREVRAVQPQSVPVVEAKNSKEK